LGVSAAQFFTNAVDTRTLGADLILTYQHSFGDHRIGISFAGNFNDMTIDRVYTNTLLSGKEDTYFGEREKRFLLASAPKTKLNLTVDYKYKGLSASLRFVRFDKILLQDFMGADNLYKAKVTTDLSLGYQINDHLNITIGGSNILNVYPDQQIYYYPDGSRDIETESGGLWDAVQMGFSGAFWYAKLGVKL
jgi:iron complex outermembrane receptor protein